MSTPSTPLDSTSKRGSLSSDMSGSRRSGKRRSRRGKFKQAIPGMVTKVRGAQYQLPLVGRIDDLSVDVDSLKDQIRAIEAQHSSPSPGTVTPSPSHAAGGATSTFSSQSSASDLPDVLPPRLPDAESASSSSPLQSLIRPVAAPHPGLSISACLEASKRQESRQLVDLDLDERHDRMLSTHSSGASDSSTPHSEGSTRHERLRRLIEDVEVVDLEGLQKAAWGGVPWRLRAAVWKVLLGYWPCNRANRSSIERKRRGEYSAFVKRYCSEEALAGLTEYERKQHYQISIDVPRTNPDIPLFQSADVQASLQRILFAWAMRHHASGYVQGMNDILSVFYVVLLVEQLEQTNLMAISAEAISQSLTPVQRTDIECDAFWLFSFFLDGVQDHYTVSQPGIQRMLSALKILVKKVDFPLFEHINRHLGMQFIQLFFRWLNCLLMRELSVKLVVRLFDAYVAEGVQTDHFFERLHVCVCAAFLKNFSERLKALDSTEFVLFLQHLPTQKWTFQEVEMLLAQAYILQELYPPMEQQ